LQTIASCIVIGCKQHDFYYCILIESCFISYIATCGFDTKMRSSKGKTLMNWNIPNEWYNGNVLKTQNKQQVE
jgi:hypothetical protein